MKLHVFNPEHDLALAFGGRFFTAPHAGRQLRSDLSFLPSIWAEDGDAVLVDDVDNALYQLRLSRSNAADVMFVTRDELAKIAQEGLQILPWGWDAALKHQFEKAGIAEELLPSEEQLSKIRFLSSRKWAAARLGNTGVYCRSLEAVRQLMADGKCHVLKAPWSSSGRGVRYAEEMTSPLAAWTQRVIDTQQGIMVEPYYNKVRDFGMEFEALPDGKVIYVGLSIFNTVNGAYQGNVLASEKDKEEMLCKHVGVEVLRAACEKIIKGMSGVLRNIYVGPFGVDMMIYVNDDGQYAILPCVEMNLRRTMGHVAIALTDKINPDGTAPHQLMRIEYDGGHYHFRRLKTNDNALNTSVIY